MLSAGIFYTAFIKRGSVHDPFKPHGVHKMLSEYAEIIWL